MTAPPAAGPPPVSHPCSPGRLTESRHRLVGFPLVFPKSRNTALPIALGHVSLLCVPVHAAHLWGLSLQPPSWGAGMLGCWGTGGLGKVAVVAG